MVSERLDQSDNRDERIFLASKFDELLNGDVVSRYPIDFKQQMTNIEQMEHVDQYRRLSQGFSVVLCAMFIIVYSKTTNSIFTSGPRCRMTYLVCLCTRVRVI